MTRCSVFLYTNAHSFHALDELGPDLKAHRRKSMMLEQNLIPNLFRRFGLSCLRIEVSIAEVRKVEICQQKVIFRVFITFPHCRALASLKTSCQYVNAQAVS